MGSKKCWWLFCQVIDNFGDIGVCFRLAKQLVREYQYEVVLWVDDLVSFAKLCPQVAPSLATQNIFGITVLHWQSSELLHHVERQSSPDVLIEAFACDLPSEVLEIVLQNQALWINLEYLSAEEWVEGCHLMTSPQKSGLNKYFFFPGFTKKTGGLLREKDLDARRQNFINDTEAQNIAWQYLGSDRLPERNTLGNERPFVINLFTYASPVLSLWIDAWVSLSRPILVLIPEGGALASLSTYFGLVPKVGDSVQLGLLKIQVIPFVEQEAFDYVLWLADLNIVRGEDSFIRAHWAEKPFFWHIYPQDDAAHEKKLHAFWQRAYSCFTPANKETHEMLSDELNGVRLLDNRERNQAWKLLFSCYEAYQEHSKEWASIQKQLPDMSQQLAKLVKN